VREGLKVLDLAVLEDGGKFEEGVKAEVNVKYLLSGTFQHSVKACGFELVVLGLGRGEVPVVLRSHYLIACC
jgi:hypothetical protein